MTKENVLKLYKHYCKINYKVAKEDMEKKRPWVTEKYAEDISKESIENTIQKMDKEVISYQKRIKTQKPNAIKINVQYVKIKV